jgi:tetratricopeptide (TPR) repeat protein
MNRRGVCIIALVLCSLWAVGAWASEYAGDPEAARPHNERAVQAYEAGDYPGAATEFGEAYRAYQHPEFLYNQAQCRRRAGQYDQALEIYERYLHECHEPSPTVHLHIGDCHMHLNEAEQAVRSYHRYLGCEMFNRGAAHARLALGTDTPCDAHDDAVVQQVEEAYRAALEDYRNDTAAAAQSLIQAAERLHVPEFFWNAGSMYQMDQMWDEAVQTYRRYVQSSHPLPEAWVDLASCLEMTNDMDGARQAAQRYLQIAPHGEAAEDANAIIRSAGGEEGGGETGPSAEDRTRAAELSREAQRLYQARQYDQAIAQYRAANAIVPTRANLFNICMCLTSAENWPDAALQWEEYLRGGDEGYDAVGHVFAAQAYYMSHSFDRAREHAQAYQRLAEQNELPGEAPNLRYLEGLTRDIERESRGASGE